MPLDGAGGEDPDHEPCDTRALFLVIAGSDSSRRSANVRKIDSLSAVYLGRTIASSYGIHGKKKYFGLVIKSIINPL